VAIKRLGGMVLIYILIIVTIFLGERRIKKYIEENKKAGKKEEILKGNIILTKYHNKGAMLNFLEKKPNIVLALSGTIIGITILLFAKTLAKDNNKLLKFGMSLLLGGALSNLSDRIEKGYVVDYFSFKGLKNIIFNLSDIFIFIGGIFIVISKRDV
jgi:signal peptidase II